MSNILGNMPPVFGSGYRGVVPAPTAADVSAQNILRADGTWGAQATSGPLPSQTGNAGKLLTTDGTNASWASSLNTFTFGDVQLGTSGPSAKSSIAARAARQGLGQDGTAASSTSVPAYGTSDFTASAFINTDLTVNVEGIFGSNSAGGFGLFVYSSGQLGAQNIGIATVGSSTGAISANKTAHVVYTRSGTTGTFYINGVSAGTITDSTNYTAVTNLVGNVGGLNVFKGSISGAYLYNRALSAAEVVSLYESGVPSGADYNSASNTSLITGDNSTFASDTGYWTKASATIGSGVCTLSAGGYIYKSAFYSGVGRRYRLVVTINSIVSGNLQVNTGNSAVDITGATAPGTYTFEYSVVSPGTAPLAIAATTGQIVIDNVLIYPLGLLLAPDAAQAGGGLTWYDTSGNAANITLPASGVTWNVPSSLKLGGNWTVAGTFTNTSTAQLAHTYTGAPANFTFGTYDTSGNASLNVQSNANLLFATFNTERARIASNGNVLVGTTTDGGQKLQVNGSASFNGIVSNSNGNSFLSYGPNGSDIGARIWCFSDGAAYIDAGATTGTDKAIIRFRTGSSLNTALTLDSSQNATFAAALIGSSAETKIQSSATSSRIRISGGTQDDGAGVILGGSTNGGIPNTGILAMAGSTIASWSSTALIVASGKALKLGNAYTAGAVVTTGYVTIQDSSGTTYKIPVGT